MKKLLMTEAQLMRRIARAEAKQRKRLLKQIKSTTRSARAYKPDPADDDAQDDVETRVHNWTLSDRKQLERPYADAFPLRFLKRRKVFVNYKESCDFDPLTGLGHSYRWYELTRVIKGKLVLNTYGYSNQTRKHVNQVDKLFQTLGLRFIEIEAPQGLQNAEAAVAHAKQSYADAIIREKYARIKSKRSLRPAQDLRDRTCELFGVSLHKGMAECLEKAEQARKDRLERQRARRFQLMQLRSHSDTPPPGIRLLQGGAA
jgi:hypothetical protein